MASSSAPFIVAGGGIGGLTTALVLARAGHSVHVLEQGDAFGEIGAGIQLGPNAFRMFDHLGLTDAIRDVAYFPPNLVMRDVRSGELLVRAPVGEQTLASHGQPYGVIYRVDLHHVLLERCGAMPAIALQAKSKAIGFTQHDGGVEVQLADGRRVNGCALIGADGLWSRVREQIVGDGKPRVSGHVAYRAVLPMNQVPSHLYSADVTLWGGEKTHLVHYPLRRGELFNLVAVFHSDRYEEGWNTFGDPDELHARFAQAAAPVRELLAKIQTWKMWVLCDREPVAHWSQGRATLLGDAAHPMLQYLAQGACMAIEDAVTLGAAVREMTDDLPRAFQAYERARYLRTGRAQWTARLYGEIYHASGVMRELRNRMFQSGSEAAGFIGTHWLYQGIDPDHPLQ